MKSKRLQALKAVLFVCMSICFDMQYMLQRMLADIVFSLSFCSQEYTFDMYARVHTVCFFLIQRNNVSFEITSADCCPFI